MTTIIQSSGAQASTSAQPMDVGGSEFEKIAQLLPEGSNIQRSEKLFDEQFNAFKARNTVGQSNVDNYKIADKAPTGAFRDKLLKLLMIQEKGSGQEKQKASASLNAIMRGGSSNTTVGDNVISTVRSTWGKPKVENPWQRGRM
jgi:hypothetical protein